MAKSKRTWITVEGKGRFPVDMLRYDQCWPLSEAKDSSAIGASFYDPGETLGLRRVVVVTDNQSAPTVARWQSMGWQVVGYGDMRDMQKHPSFGRMDRADPMYRNRRGEGDGSLL